MTTCLVGKRRQARGSTLVQLAMNTTNAKLAAPTRPGTCQQPSLGKETPLDQSRHVRGRLGSRRTGGCWPLGSTWLASPLSACMRARPGDWAVGPACPRRDGTGASRPAFPPASSTAVTRRHPRPPPPTHQQDPLRTSDPARFDESPVGVADPAGSHLGRLRGILAAVPFPAEDGRAGGSDPGGELGDRIGIHLAREDVEGAPGGRV
jgi:hypothetical protein